jgi:hypothetical protein
MTGSAREMKEGLDAKSGFPKYLQARGYRRAAKGALRYAQVAFLCDLSFRAISYNCHHRKHRTEVWTQLGVSTNRVHHRDLVSFTFALNAYSIRELDSAYGIEDIESRVIRTAQSQYRCFLSCRDPFPTDDTKEELAKAVWKEACAREARPDLSCQDEEAGLFFCHM